MSLSTVHRTMIESRHAVLMGTWLAMSTIQMISHFGGFKSLHKALGRFTMFILLPSILVEVHTNAVVVFWPEKPNLLARAVQGKAIQDFALWESILYTMPLFFCVFDTCIHDSILVYELD
jgi:hypothetical protein